MCACVCACVCVCVCVYVQENERERESFVCGVLARQRVREQDRECEGKMHVCSAFISEIESEKERARKRKRAREREREKERKDFRLYRRLCMCACVRVKCMRDQTITDSHTRTHIQQPSNNARAHPTHEPKQPLDGHKVVKQYHNGHKVVSRH